MATKKTTKRPPAKKKSAAKAKKPAKAATTKSAAKSTTKAAKSAAKKTSKKAVKKTTKKTVKTAAKKATKTAAKKRSSQAPKKSASAMTRKSAPPRKRRTTLSPGRANRPTQPASPIAKQLDAASTSSPMVEAASATPRPSSGTRQVVVPMPERPAPPPPAEPAASASTTPSYLESMPEDHAALVAGLFQVFRGVAKDLRTLFTQALALSHKNNRRGR